MLYTLILLAMAVSSSVVLRAQLRSKVFYTAGSAKTQANFLKETILNISGKISFQANFSIA
jgi:hypothetical protein